MENDPTSPQGNQEVKPSVEENILNKKEETKLERGMESPNELAWRDAWDYCKSLGEVWRLPNSEELRKILVDDTAGARKNVKYWSSWHYGDTSTWHSCDEEGKLTADYGNKAEKYFIIPVKG